MALNSNNMSVFTNGIANLPDLAKNFLYQIVFDFESQTLKNIAGADNLMIRARTAQIPSKEFSDLSTEYLGSKIVYPGKVTIANQFDVQFDEFQDMYVSKAFHRWMNLMYNQGFSNDITIGTNDQQTGGAISHYLTDYTSTVTVSLLDSSLKTKLPIEYKFYYVWPKSLQSASLGMESSDKLIRTVSLQYSTFEVVDTGIAI